MHVFSFVALALLAGGALPPAPAGEELTAAEADVQDVFGAELAKARKPADKLAVARKMIETAAGSRPAAKYALLVRARDLAIAAGDSTVGVRAVEGLVVAFAPEKPQDAQGWAREGHRVWNEVERKRPQERLRAQLEGAESYLRAFPLLEGFQKTAVGNRLRELGWQPRFLSLTAAARLFGLDPPAWKREGDCLRGSFGDLNTAKGWAMATIEKPGSSVKFGLAMKAPTAQCIRVELDGTSWAYVRGSHANSHSGFWWGREGHWNMTGTPDPRSIDPPDGWHRLAATIAAGKLTFRYDGEIVREVPLPARSARAAIRVGFGRQTAEVQVKDFELQIGGPQVGEPGRGRG